LKKLDRKWRTNVTEKVLDNSSHGRSTNEHKPNIGKGAQCFECEHFGHIKLEYPTFLKKQKKECESLDLTLMRRVKEKRLIR
jgi:hypothetical protein